MQTSGGAGLWMSMHLVSIIFEIRVNKAALCFHHCWVSIMCFIVKERNFGFHEKDIY